MKDFLTFIFHNFFLVALGVACIWALIRQQGLLSYFMLLPIGLGGIWAFYLYAFHTELGAKLAGWNVCNFQYSAAAAFLGLGINGIIAFKKGRDFRLSVILFASALFWGDLIAHFYQAYYIGESASSNTAFIMYGDFLIPSALWIAFTLDL